MILVKHPTLGNKHVHESEQTSLEAEGWVKWPRAKAQKVGSVVEAVEEKADAPSETVVAKTRADLLVDAEALEIKVDGRWSDKRLMDEIKKVEAELSK